MKNANEKPNKNAKQRVQYKHANYRKWPVVGKQKHVTIKHKILMWVTTFAVFAYVFWRLFFTLPLDYGIPSLICGVLLFVAEISSFIILLSNFREAIHYIEPEIPDIPVDWYPDVDLFITTHNESYGLMYKTVNSCMFLDYPDKSKVHVWLCDDGNRPEMKKLTEELGAGYIGMTGNKHAKAGNMNNAFWQTSSPLVVTVDADMVLCSDFLMETVPYFFLPKVKKEDGVWKLREESEIDPDYKIGFVQSPQSFYNPDLFQFNLFSERNIPNEQDYFFTEVNVAKNNDNAAQYAGSNTVISREGLAEIGGFATESITEDFLTGVMLLQSGYRNFGISKQLAHGLCPDTIGSLMGQRERWARGNVQVFKLLRIFTTKYLNFWQKFELTATFCYWLTFISRTIYLLGPIVAVLFNLRIIDAPVWQTLVFWLPHYVLFYFAQRVFSDNTRNSHWTSVIDTIMAPYLTLPTIMELIGFEQKKFVVTNKDKIDGVEVWRKFVYTLPHGLLLAASLLSVFVIFRQSIALGTVYNPIVLFWLIVGVKNLLFALFFMLGRTNYRNAERFVGRLQVTVEAYGIEYSGHTTDFSDSGLAVEMDAPLNTRSDTLVDVTVKTEFYSAKMKCKVVNVKEKTDESVKRKRRKRKKTVESPPVIAWKYGLIIEELDEANRRQYYQILYDRPHSLPKRFAQNNSIFDDVNTNIKRRTQKTEFNYRKMPRIHVSLPFEMAGGRKGLLQEFNFEYASVDLGHPLKHEETLNLEFGDTLELKLRRVSTDKKMKKTLYHVLNSEELLADPDYIQMIEKWLAFETMPYNMKPVGSGTITQFNDISD